MGTITRNFANNVLSGGAIDATDGIDGVIPSSNITNSSVTNITALPAAVGETIESIASDPESLSEGQMWYNSTSAILKVRSVTTAGTFASGGNLNTAKHGGATAGTQTAALYAAGQSPGLLNQTELYNGTSWTSNPATLNTARTQTTGFGTQTAALVVLGYVGGAPYNLATEKWNGTSWTAFPTTNTARTQAASAGADSNSGLAFGGWGPPLQSASESWNGSTWTNTPSLNTARANLSGLGTQTAALALGGSTPAGAGSQTATESWNGSSWTSVNSLNTSRGGLGTSGTQTLGLAFGGYNPGYFSSTELWNGTSWTSNPTGLSTARTTKGSPAGSQTVALASGGVGAASYTAATEEWTGPGVAQTKTITVS
jgi:hypothetical protein